MPRFDPQPGTQIQINNLSFEVMPHPSVSSMAFGQEGRKAVVYQVLNGKRHFAFKIFKRPFRSSQLADTCQSLFNLRTMPGLEVCERLCLTTVSAPDLLQQYPEMEYAVLMPWVNGKTWFDIVFSSQSLSPDTARQLAKRTAHVLTSLETRSLAHCDVAGGNVVVNTQQHSVSLIDVEDMYGASFQLIDSFPAGTMGYQHRAVGRRKLGQWCAEGDRFAGAVLLAEMLTWHHVDIRKAADKEHFFGADDMHNLRAARYKLMVEALRDTSTELASLFTQAWTSKSLDKCPRLSEWATCLDATVHSSTNATTGKPHGLGGQSDGKSATTKPIPTPNSSGLTAQELIEKIRAETAPSSTGSRKDITTPPTRNNLTTPTLPVAPTTSRSQPLLYRLLRRSFLAILSIIGWAMLLMGGAVTVAGIFGDHSSIFTGLVIFFLGLWLVRKVSSSW